MKGIGNILINRYRIVQTHSKNMTENETYKDQLKAEVIGRCNYVKLQYGKALYSGINLMKLYKEMK